MRRMQVQIEESTYEALRRRAFERRRSLAATVRELLEEALRPASPRRRRLKDFKFIGAGASKRRGRVSVEHDAALGDERW